MKDEINELIEKYNHINSLGYIKSCVPYKNGSGITLEHLLGASGGEFSIPDFKGIEIKAMRDYNDVNFDLFNVSPDGKHVFPSQWISNNFGYPDKDYKNIRVFKGNIYHNFLNKIGLFYHFKLKVDYENQKIILQVFNYHKRLINQDIYWDFDTLKFRLENKLKYLAIFNVKKIKSGNSYYYFYNDLKIFSLKSFEMFLKLIEDNIVFVTFKTGVVKSGIYKGKFQDHGTAFRISRKNVEKLFNKIY